MAKNRFYAVAVGRQPGMYSAWEGRGGAREQVDGYKGAKYRGFPTEAEAQAWLRREVGGPYREEETLSDEQPKTVTAPETEAHDNPAQAGGVRFRIYTDGGCIGNPGPGGYGVVIQEGARRTEMSGGFRRTTNNRMELMACIAGLQRLRGAGAVRLFSDSSYVVRAMSEGWATRWRAHGWWRNKRERAENADLWARLLALCDERTVEFVWVRGHSGHPQNERCDQLAMQAARRRGLPPDEGFEAAETSAAEQMSLI